jgi:hypothetical protein
MGVLAPVLPGAPGACRGEIDPFPTQAQHFAEPGAGKDEKLYRRDYVGGAFKAGERLSQTSKLFGREKPLAPTLRVFFDVAARIAAVWAPADALAKIE